MIKLHGLTLNNNFDYKLDTSEERNFQEVKNLRQRLFSNKGVTKRRPDDNEHAEIWSTRGGIFKEHAWNYFKYKWSGTWREEPTKIGWAKNWSEDFIKFPPDLKKSKVKLFYRYIYFEKDIYNLKDKNYLI